MSNGQGEGAGKPPYDDRTLLDPLSNDELRALREARQRMQAKKEPSGSAVAHQIVIGPDMGEDIGDAPTRAIPGLPTFEGNVSLDEISMPPGGEPQQRMTGVIHDPASMPPTQPDVPAGATPSDPMSVLSQADTVAPTVAPGVVVGTPAGRPANPGSNIPHHPTSPGFGENTLLWMQPPKPAPMPMSSPSGHTLDFINRPEPVDRNVVIARAVAGGLGVLLVVSIIVLLFFPQLIWAPKGQLEIHSTPARAEVFIKGVNYQVTPVKLTLSAGQYEILLKREGYEPATFVADVEPEKAQRRDVDLVPISQDGLMTVRIDVKNVPATITIDRKTYGAKRRLMVPNLDPTKPHTIKIEAEGYVTTIQEIKARELKDSYTFVLQQSK